MFLSWFKHEPDRRTARQILGARGEKAAAKHLRRHGYKILTRNFRSGKAEVDLIARDKDWLVFVEVKTRKSEEFGAPSEAVQADKERNVSRAALDYLRKLGNPRIHFRFDIVEVVIPDGSKKPHDIRLIQNAFDLSEPFIY